MENDSLFKIDLVHTPSSNARKHWINIQMVGWYRCVREVPEYYSDGIPGYDFVCSMKGRGWMEVNGRKAMIPSPSLTLMDTSKKFGVGPCEGSTWEFLYIHFDWLGFNSIYETLTRSGNVFTLSMPAMAEEEFWSIYKLKKEEDIRFEFLAFQKILNLLGEIYMGTAPDTGHKSSRPEIDRVLEYVRGNYRKPIYLHELSSMAGYNEDYLSRTFKRETGYSLQEFIIKCRLEAAKSLLLKSRCPIKEVAVTAGFDNPAYFSRLFKARVGVTPLEYREKRPLL